MIFSEIHDWQGDPAVKQILVFPSELIKLEFEKAFAERVEKEGIEKASDSNIGAIYKLRAILTSDGKYTAVVRCGYTGESIIDYDYTYKTIDQAMIANLTYLWSGIWRDCNKLIKLIDPTKGE